MPLTSPLAGEVDTSRRLGSGEGSAPAGGPLTRRPTASGVDLSRKGRGKGRSRPHFGRSSNPTPLLTNCSV